MDVSPKHFQSQNYDWEDEHYYALDDLIDPPGEIN